MMAFEPFLFACHCLESKESFWWSITSTWTLALGVSCWAWVFGHVQRWGFRFFDMNLLDRLIGSNLLDYYLSGLSHSYYYCFSRLLIYPDSVSIQRTTYDSNTLFRLFKFISLNLYLFAGPSRFTLHLIWTPSLWHQCGWSVQLWRLQLKMLEGGSTSPQTFFILGKYPTNFGWITPVSSCKKAPLNRWLLQVCGLECTSQFPSWSPCNASWSFHCPLQGVERTIDSSNKTTRWGWLAFCFQMQHKKRKTPCWWAYLAKLHCTLTQRRGTNMCQTYSRHSAP